MLKKHVTFTLAYSALVLSVFAEGNGYIPLFEEEMFITSSPPVKKKITTEVRTQRQAPIAEAELDELLADVPSLPVPKRWPRKKRLNKTYLIKSNITPNHRIQRQLKGKSYVIQEVVVDDPRQTLTDEVKKSLTQRFKKKHLSKALLLAIGKKIKKALDKKGFVTSYPYIKELDQKKAKVVFGVRTLPVTDFQINGKPREYRVVERYAKAAMAHELFNLKEFYKYMHIVERATNLPMTYELKPGDNREFTLIVNAPAQRIYTGEFGIEKRLMLPDFFGQFGFQNLFGRHTTLLHGGVTLRARDDKYVGVDHSHYFGFRGNGFHLSPLLGQYKEKSQEGPSYHTRKHVGVMGHFSIPLSIEPLLGISLVVGGDFIKNTLASDDTPLKKFDDRSANMKVGISIESMTPKVVITGEAAVYPKVWIDKNRPLSDEGAATQTAHAKAHFNIYARGKTGFYSHICGLVHMSNRAQLRSDRAVFDGANYAFGFPDEFLVGYKGVGGSLEIGVDKSPDRAAIPISKFYVGLSYCLVDKNLNQNFKQYKDAFGFKCGWRFKMSLPVRGDVYLAVPIVEDQKLPSMLGGSIRIAF